MNGQHRGGGSYIELPGAVKRKQACVNVHNDDDRCFMWAILSALHPVGGRGLAHRVSKYRPFEDELNFDGIEFPMKPRQVAKFEEQNDVSVNVFILKKQNKIFEVSPIHTTSRKKDRHVNLLMVRNHYVDGAETEPETESRSHYVWIKNLSRLLNEQLLGKRVKKYICDRCLYFFHTAGKLASHEAVCRIRMTDINAYV